MSATAVYASRFERTLLADPEREIEVFTVARARGDLAPTARPWWLPFWVPDIAQERLARSA